MSQVASTDELVTKTDLANFYQGILPYLGGMPEIVANKFTKSDLYSTDEKIIGQWIDGKPIYQKTVSCGKAPNNTSKIISHNIINIEKCIYQSGLLYSGTYSYPIPNSNTTRYLNGVYVDTSNIIIVTNWDASNCDCYITLQYTKSTDSAISIGNETDYSTDEKIIGTWVDGKPIYQKTVDCGALPNNTTKKVSIGVANIDNVKNIYGYAYAPGANRCIDLPYSESTGNCLVDIRDLSTTPCIRLVTNYNFSSFTESYVTIQYTKTTD